jgi:hypothetical protein
MGKLSQRRFPVQAVAVKGSERRGFTAQRALVLYLPGALVLLSLVTACELTDWLCFDHEDWRFENQTALDVRVTPFYRQGDGSVGVVPRHGWQQTEFELPPRQARSISLDRGPYASEEVLVESKSGAAWSMRVTKNRVTITEDGPAATTAELAAKRARRRHRLVNYVVAALLPMIWVLPLLGLTSWRKAR